MEAADQRAWQTEKLIHDGDQFFSELLSEIAVARISIDFECYIFQRDILGERVLKSLREAAERGVRVRLVVDGIGSPAFNSPFVRLLDHQGILTRIYHPMPWAFPLTAKRLARYTRTRRLLNRLFLLNRRDHRKICLIDSKSAWLGSMNVDAHHLREIHGERAWHDLGLRVEGEGISRLEDAFRYAWRKASGLRTEVGRLGNRSLGSRRRIRKLLKRPMSRLSRLYASAVRLNSNALRRREQYLDLLDRVASCRTRAWIATPYFAPEYRMMKALIRAAREGADVRILIPRRSDVFFMPWVTQAFYAQLLLGGVRVFEYLPTFLHAKSMTLDDWSLVGSSNLNHRSLLHDLEVDVVLESKEAKQSLIQRYLLDFSRSQEIGLPGWRRLPLFQRLIGRGLLFFKYWL